MPVQQCRERLIEAKTAMVPDDCTPCSKDRQTVKDHAPSRRPLGLACFHQVLLALHVAARTDSTDQIHDFEA
jgi:hypothetical protein